MSFDFAFLDSGVGGIPYMQFLLQEYPFSSCVYVADSKNFPYGQKSSEEIIEKSCNCVSKIISKWNPGAVIIACNTISVTALQEMRKIFPNTPFIGTVPAIKPAALVSKTKKIGLLATNAAVNHPYTKKLIMDFARDCVVFSRGDPELISFIEHKFSYATEEERLFAVKPAVDFFRKNGCDVIVLACTHFLNMAEYFEKVCGDSIKVIDSRNGVVRHAMEVVSLRKVEFSSKNQDKAVLYVTGFTQESDENSYIHFCKKLNIPFGGLL